MKGRASAGLSSQPRAWIACDFVQLPEEFGAVTQDKEAGGSMVRIAQYLGASGNFSVARDLFQVISAAYAADDAYGAEHPATLTARGNLAYWTDKAERGP